LPIHRAMTEVDAVARRIEDHRGPLAALALDRARNQRGFRSPLVVVALAALTFVVVERHLFLLQLFDLRGAEDHQGTGRY